MGKISQQFFLEHAYFFLDLKYTAAIFHSYNTKICRLSFWNSIVMHMWKMELLHKCFYSVWSHSLQNCFIIDFVMPYFFPCTTLLYYEQKRLFSLRSICKGGLPYMAIVIMSKHADQLIKTISSRATVMSLLLFSHVHCAVGHHHKVDKHFLQNWKILSALMNFKNAVE